MVAAGPDAVGFVLWPGSARYVPPEVLADWLKELPGALVKVGVFVDPSREDVLRGVESGLDVVQLHGSETAGFCAGLPARIWKVVHVNRSSPMDPAAYSVEALLLDHYGGAQQPGGTGCCVDLEGARAFAAASAIPVVLAGGLRPDNVRDAIRIVRPWGVDVSSGVESAPGVKDAGKVKAFIEACRNEE